MIDVFSADKTPLERALEFTPHILEGESLEEVVQGHIFKAHPFVIASREGLALTEESAFSISDVLFSKVQEVALSKGLKTGQFLRTLGHNEDNVILHEQSHLRETFLLRPHLIDETSIKIFFATQPEMNGEIGTIGDVFLPISLDQPYTLLEYARINLAPVRPSESDYLQVEEFTRICPFEMEDLYAAIAMLRTKPKGAIRDYVIRSLEDPEWARSVTQNDMDKWKKEDLLSFLNGRQY